MTGFDDPILNTYDIEFSAIRKRFQEKQAKLWQQYIDDLESLKKRYKRDYPEWYNQFKEIVKMNDFLR